MDLVVPHQANLRIIEAVARKARVPMERQYVNVQRYGNMSAASARPALRIIRDLLLAKTTPSAAPTPFLSD